MNTESLREEAFDLLLMKIEKEVQDKKLVEKIRKSLKK